MKLLLLTLTLLLFCSPAVHAQQKRPSIAVSPYAVTALDPDVMKLPQHYRGVDPEALYKELEKRSKAAQKDEFENTAAFNARLQRMQAQKLLGTFGVADLIPVAAATDTGSDGVQMSYDADAAELTVHFEPQAASIGVGIDLERRAIGLRHDLLPTTKYVGMNAYGAKAVIEKMDAFFYSLLFENVSAFSLKPIQSRFDSALIQTRLKLTPTAAREAKENLRVLFFARLSEPPIEQGYMRKTPTISEPTEMFVAYNYLVASVEQIWLYNYETGEIYKKIIPNN